jgi:hypothetical protein
MRGIIGVLPPVAISTNDYAFLGDGTGTQQNARYQFGVRPPWETEGEPGRLLAELGVFGYLLIWVLKVGLMVALLRSAAVLNAAGHMAMSGGALAYAFFAFVGNSAFDHIWQALFFVGGGLTFIELRRTLQRILSSRFSVTAPSSSMLRTTVPGRGSASHPAAPYRGG